MEIFDEAVSKLIEKYQPVMLIIGDRTNSKAIFNKLRTKNLPIEMIDEDQSSIEGRYRYLKENTKGLARLIPIGLRIPTQPFDDYVAIVLGERFLTKQSKNNSLIIQ